VAGAAAPAARCSENDKIITFSSNAWGTISFYTPFAVAPPQSTITNTGLDCGAPAADRTVSCTAATAGNASAKFDFGSTYGRFYFHTYAAANTTSNWAGKLASPNFGLGIISPTEPMRLSTAATNDRGSVGYADSGYVIDDAWGVNGHNHRVAFSGWLVTDGRGLQPLVVWKGSYIPQPYDVPITETTISCPITVVDRVGSPPNSPAISGDVCTAGSPRSLTVIATDPDADKIRYAVDWDANGTIDKFVPAAGYVPSGTSRTASRTYATAGIKRVKVLTQDETGLTSSWSTHVFTCSGVSVVEVQPQPQAQANATPDLNIRAVPSLVRPGRTTKLSWSSSSMRSCSVSGSNGDLWEPTETDKRLESPIGGDQSSTIKAETVFMLSCDGLDGKAYSKQATVRVIPSWTEQ
jgi:hypothetical protein